MSPRENRFVCHVGAHGTGTRQVQRYLRDHTDHLAGQGLHYLPREVTAKLVGGGPKLLADPEPLAEELRRSVRRPGIRGCIASHENTIGRPFTDSSGGLYADAGPAVEALAELAAPYRCTIVLSVRPQADFLESYYLQLVNEGTSDSFSTWLGTQDLDDLSWLPLHQRLVGAFGADAVRVLDYQQVGADPVAHVGEFFRLIDVELPQDPRVTPVRSGRHSDKSMRLAVAANPWLRTAEERLGLRRFLQRSFSERDYPRAVLLSDEQRAQLDERYRDEYRQLVTQPVGGARS